MDMVRLSIALIGTCLSMGNASAQSDTPKFVDQYKSGGLTPAPRAVQLDGKTGLPIPKGTTASTLSALTTVDEVATEEERQKLLAAVDAAKNSPNVSAKLGNNYRLISGGALPAPKGSSDRAEDKVRLTYFNYATNRAIEVDVAGRQINRVKERELGYQPPVSTEELAAAADILKRTLSPTIGTFRVETLRGLVQSGEMGRREVFITTAIAPSDGTSTMKSDSLAAVVDLSSGTLVSLRNRY